MKILYALIFACLSLQACIGQPETPAVSTNVNERTAALVVPAIKPIDGAEFEGTSRDDAHTAWAIDDDVYTAWSSLDDDDYIAWSSFSDEDYTAGVNSPATKPIPSDTGADSYFGDDYGAAMNAPEDYVIDSDLDFYTVEGRWGP